MEGTIKITLDELLATKGKIRRFQHMIKYDRYWHDVCSINKKNKTARIYNEYGPFEIDLLKVEEIVKYID